MFWKRWSSSQLKIFKSFAYGAGVTGGSTAFSCYLALEIEKTGHQALFFFKPQWYADVEHASGLTRAQLDSVKHQQRQSYQPLLSAELLLPEDDAPPALLENTDEEWRIVDDHENDDQEDESISPSTTSITTPSPQFTPPMFTTTTIFTADISSSSEAKKNNNYTGAPPSYATEVLACSMTA